MASEDSKRSDKPVVLITGGSRGIGAAIARAFARGGECVLALVSRNVTALETVAGECREFPGVEARVFSCDVTDAESVAETGVAVREELGVPEILVNNAGAFVAGSFLEFSLADFEEMLAVNLRSAFLVSKAFVPGMVERGSGQIVNIGSVAALEAHPGGTGYCAAKAGLLGLTRVMREELRPHGIRVTSVLPGPTETPSWDGSGMPVEQLMRAEDVAETVVNLTKLSGRSAVEEIVLRPMREG